MCFCCRQYRHQPPKELIAALGPLLLATAELELKAAIRQLGDQGWTADKKCETAWNKIHVEKG